MSAAAEGRPGRARIPVGVALIAGTVLGAAYVRGFHPQITAVPILSSILGALAAVVGGVIVAVIVWRWVAPAAARMVRRHHRAVAACAWQQGRRAAVAAGRAARIHGGPLLARWMERVRGRWDRRRLPAEESGLLPSAAVTPPLAVVPVAAPAAAAPAQNGATPMTATDPRPLAAAPPPLQRPGNLPEPTALWRAVAAAAADFDPESEAETAMWLRQQAAGLLAYAEGLMGAHSNTVDGRGVAPEAMRLLHASADTCAEAAGAIAGSARDLLTYFAEVREFKQAGKTMTRDGNWVTGEEV